MSRLSVVCFCFCCLTWPMAMGQYQKYRAALERKHRYNCFKLHNRPVPRAELQRTYSVFRNVAHQINLCRATSIAPSASTPSPLSSLPCALSPCRVGRIAYYLWVARAGPDSSYGPVRRFNLKLQLLSFGQHAKGLNCPLNQNYWFHTKNRSRTKEQQQQQQK